MYDENDKIIAKASSKWVLIDIEDMSIAKLTDEVMGAYTTEPDKAFDEKMEKLKEPENYLGFQEIKITKDMMDVNEHVHNLNYLDFAVQVIPIECNPYDTINQLIKPQPNPSAEMQNRSPPLSATSRDSLGSITSTSAFTPQTSPPVSSSKGFSHPMTRASTSRSSVARAML